MDGDCKAIGGRILMRCDWYTTGGWKAGLVTDWLTEGKDKAETSYPWLVPSHCGAVGMLWWRRRDWGRKKRMDGIPFYFTAHWIGHKDAGVGCWCSWEIRRRLWKHVKSFVGQQPAGRQSEEADTDKTYNYTKKAWGQRILHQQQRKGRSG